MDKTTSAGRRAGSDRMQIGFPAPLLGPDPVRLPVLLNGAELLALDKPCGVASSRLEGYPRVPELAAAINLQAGRGKPELARLGVEEVFPVVPLEPEVAGVVVLAKGEAAGERWRNRFGSRAFRLRFTLLARGPSGSAGGAVEPAEECDGGREIVCDLPLARHFTEPRWLVSHRTGKRSRTVFRRLERLGEFALWEAETDYYRVHQVRLHAAESGLRIPGERVYGRERPLFLSNLKPGYRPGRRRPEQPLYPGLCLHLSAVDTASAEGEACAPLPRRFEVLLKRLRGAC